MALDLQDTTSYNTEVETSDLSNAADVKIDTLQQSKNVVQSFKQFECQNTG